VTKALVLTALCLLLHALAMLALPSHTMGASYFASLIVPIISLVACFKAARSVEWATGWKWGALFAGLLLWDSGLAGAAWQDLAHNTTIYVTTVDGFIYFLYGVPLLLAIGASRNDRHIRGVLWIDGILAVAIGILAYREVFLSLPDADAPEQFDAGVRIAYFYDAENILLAVLAGVRLLAAESREERGFYYSLLLYLSVYAITIGFYNHQVTLRWQLSVGQLWDLLPDLPFLVLAICTSRAIAGSVPRPLHLSRPAMMMIQAGISVALPLVLLAFGLLATVHSPIVGIVAVVGALAGYGLRNMLSQARLMESEERLLNSRKALEQAALIDPLTGIGNRRYFNQTLEREWSRALRASEPFALLIIDVDHFKQVNDTYGHQRGDEILVTVARTLESALPRLTEHIARHGGEEFACILPATSREGAIKVAERLRTAVEALRLPNARSPHATLTVSIGATVCPDPAGVAPSMLIRAADLALYQAKREGRNRVVFTRAQSLLRRRSGRRAKAS
jgi:diguanylate cyclase (GGDEF)-like protein